MPRSRVRVPLSPPNQWGPLPFSVRMVRGLAAVGFEPWSPFAHARRAAFAGPGAPDGELVSSRQGARPDPRAVAHTLGLNRFPSCAAPLACRNNQLFTFHLPQY